jgi:hypothetical protein
VYGKCFPNVIIAGAQKSGTTALAGIRNIADGLIYLIMPAAQLSLHPWISFSRRKELHFFSRSKYFDGGAPKYLDKFEYWNTALTNPEHASMVAYGLDMPLFVEATPFYIASRDACKRMATTVPDVKLIVIMREPAARAYSEYQMKKRY